MENHIYRLLSFVLVFYTAFVFAQSGDAINKEDIIEHIRYLSSDKLKGREPGTYGSKSAVRYIENVWKSHGVLPGGTKGYKQSFEFISGVTLSGYNRLKINETRKTFRVKKDFIPLGFSASGTFEYPLVFAGYGFGIKDSLVWNDYNNIDVDGKWVLVFRGSPDGSGPHSSFSEHISLRKKYMVAKDQGAQGVLFVNTNNDENQEGLLPLRFRRSAKMGDIPVIHISRETAESLLPSNVSLNGLQEDLDQARSSMSFETGLTLSATVGLRTQKTKGTNVIGMIPGKGSSGEMIVIGAHMDHLGYGGEGSGSLQPDKIEIHNGADDNASGVAGLLELAEAISHIPLDKKIILIAFDAEEKGLLGSKHFVENPTVDMEKVVTMINLDMVGRMKDSSLTVGGTGTSPLFEPLLDSLKSIHQLNLSYSPEGFGPSDHSSFYTKDIPVLFFFTGTHEDYHKPSDDWEKINAAGETRILETVFDVVHYVSSMIQPPEFTTAGPKDRPQSRRGFKVTFGVIPSYGGSEKGLKIDGVRSGGPAESAGLQAGDIIVEIDQKTITDIYDYMHRLGELKKGQRVVVRVRRGENELGLFVQL